jgi:Mn2+/Fe2+ NRAMP family transporter
LVERIAIILGLFEVAFFIVAWKAAPNGAEMAAQIQHMPLTDPDYLYLLAANLGTSIMPWTVFYQQSALIDKGLGVNDMKHARIDTLLGVILCQVITVAVLVAAAETIGKHESGIDLNSVPQIADAFAAVLGGSVGRAVFAVGLCGGALVATVVVCLASAWAVGEVTGIHHSLEHHPTDAPWFYAAFGVILAAGGLAVASGINPIRLSVGVGVVNALLLPIVLGFIYLLARSELPEHLRLKGGLRSGCWFYFRGCCWIRTLFRNCRDVWIEGAAACN